MSEQKIKSLTALLNSYPQSVGDLELGLRTYLAVCREFSDLHVSRAVTRFLTGKVERKNREFAPSCESFVLVVEEEAIREQSAEKIKALEAERQAYLRANGVIEDQRDCSRNPLRRLPTFREKFIAQKGGGDVQNR